jgi:hypothetical protein
MPKKVGDKDTYERLNFWIWRASVSQTYTIRLINEPYFFRALLGYMLSIN